MKLKDLKRVCDKGMHEGYSMGIIKKGSV